MPRVLAFLLLASVIASGTEAREFIRVWPEKPVVEFGGSVVLNCSSNCNGIGLETNLDQVPAGNGMTWKAFNLTGVNQWAPTPSCYAGCTSNIKPPRAEITVYRAPERVALDPVPKMEVGKEYNLTCRISNVAPIRNLTVTLLKAGKTVLVKTFESHTEAKAGEVVVTHNIMAEQADHGREVTCHTALDLKPDGPLLEHTSSSETLTAVVFSTDPHLEAPLSMETNTKMAVNCDVSGVFPAEEARFDLLFAGKSWNFSRSMSGASVSAQALVSSSSAGEHALICTVSLGSVNRRVEKMVKVYSLPKPNLDTDLPKILVNESVLLTCSCNETHSSGIEMQISDSKQILKIGYPPIVSFRMTAQEEDDGREYLCRVALSVDGHPVEKRTSIHLTVYYGARMNNLSCPDTLIWKEGSDEMFNCSAWGNPPPEVECKKGDKSYRTGVQQRIYREHHGFYRCSATNKYGSDVRIVTVRVEPAQLNILAIIIPTLLVTASLVAAVAYYMYYRSHKIRNYNLKQKQKQKQKQQQQQKAAGCPKEQKCLNGNMQTENV